MMRNRFFFEDWPKEEAREYRDQIVRHFDEGRPTTALMLLFGDVAIDKVNLNSPVLAKEINRRLRRLNSHIGNN